MALGGSLVLGVAAVAGAVLYLQRGPIGAYLAASYLKDRGVASTIVIERLDRDGFIGRVVLGDPRDPDLAIRRVEVEFEPVPLLKGGLLAPRIRSIRLVEPRLKARWDGERLTFGSLQKLVDTFSAAPAAGPGPSVVVERGSVRLLTPAGELRLAGDGALDRGRLSRLALHLQPVVLRQGPLTARVDGGSLRATGGGGRIKAALQLDVRQAAQANLSLQALHLDLAAELPYGDGLRFDGPFTLDARARAGALASGPQSLSDPRAVLNFAGASAGPLGRLSVKGSGTGSISAEGWEGPNGSARRVALAGRLVALDLARSVDATRFSLDGDLGGVLDQATLGGLGAGRARLQARFAGVRGEVRQAAGRVDFTPDISVSAARADFGGMGVRDGVIELASAETTADWNPGGWGLSGPLQAHLRAAALAQPVLDGQLVLRGFGLDLAGQAALADGASRFDLQGSARSTGGALSPEAANAVAAALPLIGTDPAGRAAVLGAFSSLRLQFPAFALRSDGAGVRVDLPRPLELVGVGGARAIVSRAASAPAALVAAAGDAQGGLVLRVAGAGLPEIGLDLPDYRAGLDAGGLTLDAETRLTAAFSGETLRGLKLDAPVHLVRRDGVLSADLSACAAISAAGFGQATEPLLTAISGRACADSAPALLLRPDGWRFQTRLDDFQAHAPAGEVDLRAARGSVALAGTGAGAPTGSADLVSAGVLDAAAVKRFEPLRLAGRLTLAQDVWTGPLRVSRAAKGEPLAVVQVAHRMADASGSADIEARGLTFAKDGLQPRDISPVAGALATEAEGVVDFTGRAEWAPGRDMVSRGQLTTRGFAFRSLFGPVAGADATLALTSLAPLESAPGQVVGARSIAWLVPLNAATAKIQLKADGLRIESATAEVSKGRATLEAMDISYAPGSAVNGVVRLDDIDLGDLIERFNLADKVRIDALIDGVVPFSTTNGALRLDKGLVFATGPGRLSISRGALTGATASAPGAPPVAAGGIQDIAYQALENLAFDTLEAEIASQPKGRLGILFKIKGRNDPPTGGETRIRVLDLILGKAFDGPIALPRGTPVNLTLDTSLNFDELLAAYNQRGRSESVQPAPAKQ